MGAQRDHGRPQLRSFFLLPAFAIASPKPAAVHDRRLLPGNRRAVLLMKRSDDLTGAAVLLLWLQGRGETEDGVLCSEENRVRKSESGDSDPILHQCSFNLSAVRTHHSSSSIPHLSYAGIWRFSSSMRRLMTSSHLPWIFSTARSSFGVHWNKREICKWALSDKPLIEQKLYLQVDNVQFGSFACWSVHGPQTSVLP